MGAFERFFARFRKKDLGMVPSNGGGWFPIVRESFAGAWQRGISTKVADVTSYSAVYACVTLICADVGKLRVSLTRNVGSHWQEVSNSPWVRVLRKPNHYQTRNQFFENWVASRLLTGNAYILKERDMRGVVDTLKVLDPTRVQVMVADDGSVYYDLYTDNLPGVPDQVRVPASEIIHDRGICLYHPLVGTSPLMACCWSAGLGNEIIRNSAHFFKNASQPSGILSAPGAIADQTADRLKAHWDANFAGHNAGKVAVLGDGLKFEMMAINPIDAQLIDQLKFSVEDVCRAFHVPPHLIGASTPPNYSIEQLTSNYYSQTLQTILESIEACLDAGLELPSDMGTEFDISQLMRMDTSSRFEAWNKAVGGGWMTPNEARSRENLPPVPGGDTPYMQEQNWPLRHLADRELPDRGMTAPAKHSSRNWITKDMGHD
ncbi:phage portal protein [Pseudomonas sp. T]|nr:phage portal protein [Pseudomonas sp. T]